MEPYGKITFFHRNKGWWEYQAENGEWKSANWRDASPWDTVKRDAITKGRPNPVWDRTNEE